MNEEQKKQVHIVLDLETMGTRQDAAIIEIGMVILNHMGQEGTTNLIDEWSSAVSLESSMKLGGTVSPTTIEWWMDTDRTEARDNWVTSPKMRLSIALKAVASRINQYFCTLPDPLIWGNGINFDNAILKSAYERLGIKVPWSYKQDADFHTLKLLYKEIVPEPAFVGTPHIALDDARHEAMWLSMILQYIYKGVSKPEIPFYPNQVITILTKD